MADTINFTAGPIDVVPDTTGIDLDALDYVGGTTYLGGSYGREAMWKKFREDRPIAFLPETDIPGFPPGPGFWSLTKFDDVMHVSRHPELFQSGKGTNIPDLPIEIAEFMGSIINMDAPKHTRTRLIVNRAFTPRMVAKIDDDVRVRARRIIGRIANRGTIDVVRDLAGPLPLEIICDMMGIPEDKWERIFECTNIILGDFDTTGSFDVLMGAVLEMAAIAQAVGEDRLANPQDDLVSAIMAAEVDGHRLEPSEMASFFILLSAAGNETTRNAISHGLHLFTTHPEQRAILMADFDNVIPTAVEEIVRYATPVVHFRRTATEDTRIGDTEIAAGDKVVMWYESANRDESHFENPYTFDVRRTPNEHVGFGAGGPHFCLGANLARREIRVMFEELFRALPDIAVSSEPTYLMNPFINGITKMNATFTPVSP